MPNVLSITELMEVRAAFEKLDATHPGIRQRYHTFCGLDMLRCEDQVTAAYYQGFAAGKAAATTEPAKG